MRRNLSKFAASRRAGVSLMEVLIGTFVLSVGLLGLAALIPIGRFAIVETGKSDRAGGCGRAGQREMKTQRMLDPTTWRHADNSQVIVDSSTASFVIDPMGIARAILDNSDVSRFPHGADPANQLSMQRITLQSMVDLNTNTPSLPLATRSFVWRDELLFDMPEDETMRPRRLVRNGVGGEVRPYPPMFEEGNFNNIPIPQRDENYSWMITVTPAYGERGFSGAEKQLYSVSVVVFWKRDYSLDQTERIVSAEMFGGGYGGGDVKLVGPAAQLNVREDQWLLLCGQASNDPTHQVFHWYRVIAAAELDGDERFVTLAGPDWKSEWCSRANNVTQAVLFDGDPGGVVGVYTTTVELDRDLVW